MPYLKLDTTVTLSNESRHALLAALSKITAETLGKPEQYMMVAMAQSVMHMSGRSGDAAFVDLRSIGALSDSVNKTLSEKICKAIADALCIPADCIYITFTDVKAGNWGWNGGTFG